MRPRKWQMRSNVVADSAIDSEKRMLYNTLLPSPKGEK